MYITYNSCRARAGARSPRRRCHRRQLRARSQWPAVSRRQLMCTTYQMSGRHAKAFQRLLARSSFHASLLAPLSSRLSPRASLLASPLLSSRLLASPLSSRLSRLVPRPASRSSRPAPRRFLLLALSAPRASPLALFSLLCLTRVYSHFRTLCRTSHDTRQVTVT